MNVIVCVFAVLAFLLANVGANVVTVPFNWESGYKAGTEVMIGSPIQKENACFDLSASEAWVVTTKCKRCVAFHDKEHFYDESVSTTLKHSFQRQNQTCVLGGYRSGEIIHENIAFGANIALKQQQMLAVDMMKDCRLFFFEEFDFGIILPMGVGENSLGTVMYNTGVISKPYFRLVLSNVYNKASFEFGDIATPSNMKWSNYLTPYMYSDGDWAVEASNVSIGGQKFDIGRINLTISQGAPIGLTGTIMNKILGIIKAYPNYYHSFYNVKCASVPSLPPLYFNIPSGGFIKLESTDYIYPQMGEDEDCRVRVIQSDNLRHGPAAVLPGDILDKFGLVFDPNEQRVGFPGSE
eukprot:TRINITY_DN26365_c0_g1_i1.p1 TRINITY_DN26365_c0_g1~~TRINITY_DN26365_c0_g1_i1.p1  ORF type:complete len:352 (+),score=110.70 TRINITY_DN26365_c0_g1_i1:27-1082(+)